MAVNLYTLADAREFLRPFVDAGSCAPDVLDGRIDEVQRRLALKPELLTRMRRRVRFTVQNQHFPIPPCVERILRVDISGEPAHVWSDYYEFLSSGPGDLDVQIPANGYAKDLQDLGEFPVQFDIPATGAYPLLAFSTAKEDLGKLLVVRGFDSRNEEVRATNGSVAVELPIGVWKDGTEGVIFGPLADQGQTVGTYIQVSQINKPATRGYVCLYAVDVSENKLYFLSKMAPEETTPRYRRYRITNTAIEGDAASILTLVQLRHVKAVRADDILTVQNLDALKLMSLAINHENSGDPQKAMAYEALAVSMLRDEKTNTEQAAVGLTVIDMAGAAMSRRNRGIIL